MKKILLTLIVGCSTTAAFADNWQPLSVGSSPPAMQGEVTRSEYVSTSSQATEYAPLEVQKVRYESDIKHSIFVEYSNYEADLDGGYKVKLKGAAIGYSTAPNQTGFYTKFEVQKDNALDAKYYEISFGSQVNLINYHGLYLLGTVGMGYSWADSSLLSNNVQFVTVPVGLELGYSFTPNFSIYTGVGYKFLFDVTSSTTCNDGTTSNSTGSGTCSYHGGISQYNDYVGNNDGMTYRAGLRLNF